MNAEAWNERVALWGCTQRSVLFKGLPDALNQEIHHYHVSGVLDGLHELGERPWILDVGCGYGRISQEVMAQYPNGRIVGLDLMSAFAKRFPEYVGGDSYGVQGSVVDLSFCDQAFDAAVVVTCLMYLYDERWREGLAEITRVVKKGGRIILIEPGRTGQLVYTWGGLFTLPSRIIRNGASNTGGRLFRLQELDDAVSDVGGRILRTWGMPGFTCCMIPLAAAALISQKRMSRLFAFTRRLDKWLGHKPRFSVYIGLVVERL